MGALATATPTFIDVAPWTCVRNVRICKIVRCRLGSVWTPRLRLGEMGADFSKVPRYPIVRSEIEFLCYSRIASHFEFVVAIYYKILYFTVIFIIFSIPKTHDFTINIYLLIYGSSSHLFNNKIETFVAIHYKYSNNK